MKSDTVTLRSRHANYRWRDVQFVNHVAAVPGRVAEAAASDPHFGQGRDFWEDTSPAGGGKNNAPAPGGEPLDPDAVGKLKKDELVALAAERGVELTGKENKAELVGMLTAPTAAA